MKFKDHEALQTWLISKAVDPSDAKDAAGPLFIAGFTSSEALDDAPATDLRPTLAVPLSNVISNKCKTTAAFAEGPRREQAEVKANKSSAVNGFVLVEQTEREVGLNCKLVDKFFEVATKSRDLKADDRKKFEALATKLAQLEARVEFFCQRYHEDVVKLAFLHAPGLPPIFEEADNVQPWDEFFTMFFELEMDVPTSYDIGQPSSTQTAGDDGGKDGERAEKITLGYLEPRIREILGLLYPGYENVHMESNVHYRIPDEFVFSNNFKMFLKQTGVKQYDGSVGGYMECDFVIKAFHPEWGPDLSTPPNSPYLRYFLSSKGPTLHLAPSVVAPRENKEAERETAGVKGDEPKTTIRVKECLPRLFALFMKRKFAPFQLGGMIKAVRRPQPH